MHRSVPSALSRHFPRPFELLTARITVNAQSAPDPQSMTAICGGNLWRSTVPEGRQFFPEIIFEPLLLHNFPTQSRESPGPSITSWLSALDQHWTVSALEVDLDAGLP